MTRFTPDLFAGSAAELTAIRRDIHRHPETAFEERRTAQIVAEKLQSWGIEVHRGLATTGVVGTLKGKRPGQKTIGLRADMDALHLQEKNDFDYASVHANKMHACGHDGHTTMLLGAAKHLAAAPDFAGTVHFIFQPAEEGLGGARVMIEEGLFEKFNCDAVYGMHNMPGFPSPSVPAPCWLRRTAGRSPSRVPAATAPCPIAAPIPPSSPASSSSRCRASSAATCRRARPRC